MPTFKYDSTVNLGHILQIIVIVLSMCSGVWYLSARQEDIMQENRILFSKVDSLEGKQKSMEDIYVRKDVNTEHNQVILEKLDNINFEILAVKAKIGLAPSKAQFWK